MKAFCKMDYGQFEMYKKYNFSYVRTDNQIKYFVEGQYSTTEFTQRQFNTLFDKLEKDKNFYNSENKNVFPNR